MTDDQFDALVSMVLAIGRMKSLKADDPRRQKSIEAAAATTKAARLLLVQK